jgi:hypothetical protein
VVLAAAEGDEITVERAKELGLVKEASKTSKK